MEPMALSGLDKLLEACQRLDLGLETSPPAHELSRVGSLLEGGPFDSMLASVYARMGHAVFATKVMGLALIQCDNQERALEKRNKWWRENYWEELGEPVIVFGGGVYTYATVPGLADERGWQPVVEVNTYEPDGPLVIPVASNVDQFFDSYARYLEVLAVEPRYRESGEKELLFPWHVPGILARDERLVELMRAGRFDALMKHVDDDTRRWAATVMGTQV